AAPSSSRPRSARSASTRRPSVCTRTSSPTWSSRSSPPRAPRRPDRLRIRAIAPHRIRAGRSRVPTSDGTSCDLRRDAARRCLVSVIGIFGTNRLRVRMATLESRNRALEGLVDEHARRSGLDEAELRRAREEALPQIPEESRRLVSEDRVIEAIKSYREHTGAGLVEAKSAIDEHRAA